MTNKRRGVFFALRPEKAHPSDHITLRYFTAESDPAFIYDIGIYYDRLLPTEIRYNGYATWKAGDRFYVVKLVDHFGYPYKALWAYTTTPHRTLISSDKPLRAEAWTGSGSEGFKANKVWLGRSTGDGNYEWVEFSKDKKKEVLEWIRNG